MSETTAEPVELHDNPEHADAHLLRTVMARECDTVNEYNELAARASEPAIRALLLHLADEEKEHIAECSVLLARLDPSYQGYLDKPLSHVDPSLAFRTESAEPSISKQPVNLSTLRDCSSALTVGSLFKPER